MNIAYTMMTSLPGGLDLLLAKFAEKLIQQGKKPCGIVQINTPREDSCPGDMDVQVLPDGPLIRISQSLGRQSQGCRLDPARLAYAIGEVAQSLNDQSDLLIVNKFGSHEAEGKGFRDVIADALSRDIPVICGVNALNKPALLTFCGGIATEVPGTIEALENWHKQTA